MAKGDFDYARAWAELAKPAFECLPANVRDLYARVCTQCVDLRQDANCDMRWPADADEARELRNAFECLDSGYLASAAHIVNAYGHWYPGKNPDTTGGHWKFAHYCDQVLRARCGVGNHERGDGLRFEIHEGLLRLCLSYPDGWTWAEVGIGTPLFLKQCRPLLPVRAWKRSDKLLAAYETTLRAIKQLPDRWAQGGSWLERFADLDAFKERGPEEVAIDDVLAGSGLRRVDIRAINFDPHPFVIGPRHLANSKSMYLDPNCAPCAHPGCRLAYDEHVCERALFVVGAHVDAQAHVELSEAQKTALVALKPVLAAQKIEGVAFLRPEDVDHA